MQTAAVPSMQQGSVSLSTHFGVPTPQQNITNALQTGSTIDTVQGSSFSSLQQGAIASIQQENMFLLFPVSDNSGKENEIRSSTPKVLRSAVSDIGSVVSMIDRIAGSAPGNGSRVAVGEDLVAMTKCRLQAKSFMSQDGSATTKKMKRDTSAMPLNNVSSAGSFNDSFKQSYGLDNSELESTATSRVKRQKVEVRYYAVHLLMM
ncbi:hypothetical protein BHE74_00004874 [Ensete ventricosum]|nr:hypothetical protein BHE74_00004874 [Ensete ventricosum]